jgi:hypothetical protein
MPGTERDIAFSELAVKGLKSFNFFSVFIIKFYSYLSGEICECMCVRLHVRLIILNVKHVNK